MKVLKIVPERCTGCLRCELACSYVQTGTFQPAKSVIRVSPFEGHTSYAPYTCFQCAEGWCMTACPVGAIVISPVGARPSWTTNAWGASSARSPARTGRCSTIPTRRRPLSVTCAAAIRRARTRARPRRSSTRRSRPRTGWASSRLSGPLGRSSRPAGTGGTDGAAPRHRRGRHGRPQRDQHDPAGGGRALGDRPGVGGAALFADGPPVLSRAHHRRVPRLHGDAREARPAGRDQPRRAPGGGGLDAKAGEAHARRWDGARVRRPPRRDGVVRRPGPRSGCRRPRGPHAFGRSSRPAACSPRSVRAVTS